MAAVNPSLSSGSVRFLTGPLAGKTFYLSKPITTIGRDATNDIVVKGDQRVSRAHARIVWNNGTWAIEKLAPQNTVTVNQQQVQQSPISNNTTIGLGEDTTFLFLVRADVSDSVPIPAQPQPVQPLYTLPPQGSAPYPGVPPPQSPYPQPPSSPFGAGTGPQSTAGLPHMRTAGLVSGRPDETQIASPTAVGLPSLEVSSNIHGTRQAYPLTKEVINIGRDANNDIAIRDGSIVSGQHLQIIRENSQFVLIHPHPDRPRTLNGLLYQGRKIRGDEPFRKVLIRGDIFRIGDENGTLITFTFNDGTGTQQETLVPLKQTCLRWQRTQAIRRKQLHPCRRPQPQKDWQQQRHAA